MIATKTKIDISGVKVPEKLNDVYFRAKKTRKTKKGDGDIFEKTDEVVDWLCLMKPVVFVLFWC